MPWEYIRRLLGPGLHWGKSQEELLEAIDRAHADNKLDAVEHLRIILKRRNAVMMEKELPPKGKMEKELQPKGKMEKELPPKGKMEKELLHSDRK